MKKICPRCSNSFVCREDRTDLCQCTRIYVIPGVRDYLKENYENCLCPECLKETSRSFHSFGVNPRYAVKNNDNKTNLH